MSKKLNIKDVKTGGGGVSKTLTPGNCVCTINKVELEPFKFKENSYHLVLHMEGPDQGKDFQGFFLDKTNESLGRHKGQVGRVNASEWAFADGKTKGGVEINRDEEIVRFLKSLCRDLGIKEWIDAQDDKHDTIESLVQAFNKERPFAGKAMEYCLAGKEYVSRGYTNYELFLPKFSKAGAPFGPRTIKFNPDEHIRKKKVENVQEFGNDETTLSGPAAQDFNLED
jgi:hypothetical protein